MECKSIYDGLQCINHRHAAKYRPQIQANPATAGIFYWPKSKRSLADARGDNRGVISSEARDPSTWKLLVLRHRVEGLGDDLPAAVGLEQGEVVGEVARRDLALDLRERGARAGEVDRHDAVAPLAAAVLGRLAALDHLEPVGAREVRGLAVGAHAVEMRGRMEGLAELLRVALVQAVEIRLQHLLDFRDVGHVVF